MKRFWIATATLLLLAAAPLAAYTIYLKDGSHIIAKQKYRIEGKHAIIILPSGTESFLDVDQIDIEKTRAANHSNYGTALVLNNGKLTNSKPATPAPKGPTLGDLIEERRVGPNVGLSEGAQTRAVQHKMAPKPYPNTEIVDRITSFLSAQGLTHVTVLRGERLERPRIDIATDSESAVFRALEAGAKLLAQLRQDHPNSVLALSLHLHTSKGEHAGNFILTPERASELLGGQEEVSEFYVRHVQF